MNEKKIIEAWNSGLNRLAVPKMYMKAHNKNLKKDEKRIDVKTALAHVEPIMFNYRMEQLKG